MVLVHALVVLAGPGVGALLFLCLTLGVRSSFHFGGALAFGFGVLFSYLFYGAKTLLLVVFTSPLFWGLSRTKSRAAAFVLAAIVGAGLGWLFGQVLMTGEEKALVTSASVAAGITGTLAALALESAWRYKPSANSGAPVASLG